MITVDDKCTLDRQYIPKRLRGRVAGIRKTGNVFSQKCNVYLACVNSRPPAPASINKTLKMTTAHVPAAAGPLRASREQPPRVAVAHLDSMFIWLIGLACLVASTEAQPAPPPAAPPVVCGPGTTLDANSSTCEINCDENNPPSNPPGRRLSESPFAPADADASDTARESREQSVRARKVIDSHLASQPDLDDALRSVISYHLERFAAERLWFTEEEE